MVENIQCNGSGHQSVQLGGREWCSGGDRSLYYHHTQKQDKADYIMHMPHVSNKGFAISMKNLMKKTNEQ